MIRSKKTVSNEDVALHYDELDAFYRDVWGEHVHHGLWRRGDETRHEAVRELVLMVAQEGKVEWGSEVCDIGCGYGATARMLAGELGAQVTAVTISPAQHAFACGRSGAADNPRYLLRDWLQNELPPGSFDIGIAIESSEHMPDLAAFFAQSHRVLKPGGRLVVCAWMAAEQSSPLATRWLLEPICREGRMPNMGTIAEYRHLAESAGFIVEKAQDLRLQVARTWSQIAGIFLRKLLVDPRYLRFLFNRHARNRVFALTMFRIWLAYRTGAMRYGVLTAKRA